MHRRVLLIIAMLSICLCSYSWSGKEHKLMAYMAQQHLTQNTQAFLNRYLDQSITEYATWMDRYRNSPGYEQTTLWHMVSVNADGSFEIDGRGKALTKLKEIIGILSNYKEYNDSTVHINLVYIIHLIPEIHCPAHYYINEPDIINRGWQTVYVAGKQFTYHHLWDCSITQLYPDVNYQEFVAIFDTWSEEEQRECSNGTPDDWCRDNLSRVRQIYDWAQPNETLPDDFLQIHRDLPETHARLGAYRLARVLNDLFDKAE